MKAVFVDRDGTLINDPSDFRVDSIDEVEMFPFTVAALKLLADAKLPIVIISNQAGIGEGRYSIEEFLAIQSEVLDLLEPSGVKILGTFICPHREDENCECRKPKPKLIKDAAKEFSIDLSQSYMVGDRETDVEAGINAGTKTVLVKTGVVKVENSKADFIADNLLEAVKYIARQA